MDKVCQTALPNLQDNRQRITREVIALRHVHFIRDVFDAMRARAHNIYVWNSRELGLKAEQGR